MFHFPETSSALLVVLWRVEKEDKGMRIEQRRRSKHVSINGFVSFCKFNQLRQFDSPESVCWQACKGHWYSGPVKSSVVHSGCVCITCFGGNCDHSSRQPQWWSSARSISAGEMSNQCGLQTPGVWSMRSERMLNTNKIQWRLVGWLQHTAYSINFTLPRK